jgi:hypothetical protein
MRSFHLGQDKHEILVTISMFYSEAEYTLDML